MSHLILIRHGNTFESGQTATWVGARTDMKLTETGEKQAQAVADMLAANHMPVGGILAGPLLRTRRGAEIISAKTNTVFTVDERLTELDYGHWENKSSDEIRALYGSTELDAWEKDGAWPESANFAPSLEKLEHNLRAFLDEQHKKLIAPNAANRVAITSNGILRFIYRQLTGHAPGPGAKVKTGAVCLLRPTEKGWEIVAWNIKPA